MLALFSSWTELCDLKKEQLTFKQAFDEFLSTADKRTKYLMDNIQYQHECSDSVAKKRAAEHEDHVVIGLAPADGTAVECEAPMEHTQVQPAQEYSLRDIEHAITSEFSHDDKLYPEVALNIAVDCEIFNEDPPLGVFWKKLALPATLDQLEEFYTSEKLVQAVTKNRVVPDRHQSLEIFPSSSGSGASD